MALQIDWKKLDKALDSLKAESDKSPGPEWFTMLDYAKNRVKGPLKRTQASKELYDMYEAGIVERMQTNSNRYYFRMKPQ